MGYINKADAISILQTHCRKCIYELIRDTDKCPDCRIYNDMSNIRELPSITVYDAINIIRDHCLGKWPACDSCELDAWCDMVDGATSPHNWEVITGGQTT